MTPSPLRIYRQPHLRCSLPCSEVFSFRHRAALQEAAISPPNENPQDQTALHPRLPAPEAMAAQGPREGAHGRCQTCELFQFATTWHPHFDNDPRHRYAELWQACKACPRYLPDRASGRQRCHAAACPRPPTSPSLHRVMTIWGMLTLKSLKIQI